MGRMIDEASFVRAAQRGDLDAFNLLIMEYQSIAFNVAYRIMGDLDSAADATQEAFISAYRNIRRFRGGSFRSAEALASAYTSLRMRKRSLRNPKGTSPLNRISFALKKYSSNNPLC